jgi:hypothetical protein
VAIDDASVGTVAWGQVDYAKASDNQYAAADLSTTGLITHYLKVTGFGFALPLNAMVEGIRVDIERWRYNPGNIRDYRVRLLKGGAIGSTDRADTGTDWPESDTYKSYGDAADLWGDTWGPGDINDPGFGAVLSATAVTGYTGLYALVDHMRITVFYSIASAPMRHRAVIADSAGTVKGQIMS